jgi:hypothetical protein
VTTFYRILIGELETQEVRTTTGTGLGMKTHRGSPSDGSGSPSNRDTACVT